MPSNHLILCCPLLIPPSNFPSIRIFSNESVLHIRWPKYWSFSFNISPSSEYSGLISFRMDWLNLLAVQGTLKSLLHHHSSKASVLWSSDFFIVQLSYPHLIYNVVTIQKKKSFFSAVLYFWNVFWKCILKCILFFPFFKTVFDWTSCHLELREEMVKEKYLKGVFDMDERVCLSKCLSNKVASWYAKLKAGTAV